MNTVLRVLFGHWVVIVVLGVLSSGTPSQAALIHFKFEGETTDPAVGGAIGHLIYNDSDFSISDLTFSIGGESLVSYGRDTSGQTYLSPFLTTIAGETRLILNEDWVFGSRRLFFLGPDIEDKQVFGDLNPDLVQAGMGKWFTPVPEPSTYFAGLMLLIPIGWSALQRYRQLKR